MTDWGMNGKPRSGAERHYFVTRSQSSTSYAGCSNVSVCLFVFACRPVVFCISSSTSSNSKPKVHHGALSPSLVMNKFELVGTWSARRFTDHVPTAYRLPTNHIPTMYRPHTDNIPTIVVQYCRVEQFLVYIFVIDYYYVVSSISAAPLTHRHVNKSFIHSPYTYYLPTTGRLHIDHRPTTDRPQWFNMCPPCAVFE